MLLVWQPDFSPTTFFSPGFGPFPQEPQAVPWTTPPPAAYPFLVALGLGDGRGSLGDVERFLEGASLSKMQGSWKHKESLTGANCIAQRTHSVFMALRFYSLLPQWRHMLGFRIRNWGRTDGRGAVGSNTIIKIIYTARNSRACARR